MDVPVQLIIAQVVNGIIVGAMYALFASGLTLIWGTMRMLNFAHGEFFMLGGFLVYFTYAVLGLPPVLAAIVAVAVIFAVGVAVERIVIHPLLSRPVWQLTTIIATLGLSMILQNAALKIWGPEFKNVPYFVEGVLDLGGVRIAYQRVLVFCVSVVSMAGLWFILKHTRFGLAVRATSQDFDAAQLYGVDIHRIFTLTFGLSAALAALAAVMLAPIMAVYPAMGLSPLLKGFVVVILGGLGNFAGAIAGGALLGVVESLSVIYFDSEWSDVVAFVFLVLVIWVRPWGLFGVEERSWAVARHQTVLAVYATLGLALFALCLVPLLVRDQYILHLFILSMIYAMLAGSWNLINGYAGIVSFGHQAFFGLGAYGSALLAMSVGLSPWLTLFLGGVLAALAGLVIGLPVLRIRSIAHVSVVTLAFAVIVQTVGANWTSLTRGSLGLGGIPPFPSFHLQPFGVVAFGSHDRIFDYYLALALLSSASVSLTWLTSSRTGLALRAIRDSEQAADSLGIDLPRYKLGAFLVSSFIAGVSGAFYAHYVQVLTPDSAMGISIMITVVVITLVGGIGTQLGPLAAAFFVTIGLEHLRFLGDYRLVAFGALLILFTIFLPGGLGSLAGLRALGSKVSQE